jgi:multidrug efflux pump subunit AcrA (membrane-fusion protein)
MRGLFCRFSLSWSLLAWLLAAIFVAIEVHRHILTRVHPQQIVAQVKALNEDLYFTSQLSPIRTTSILSPVEGHVKGIQFTYGSSVKKGNVLVILKSEDLADRFHKAVEDYLQNKAAYMNMQQSFQGTAVLYRAGIVSKESYLGDKNQFESARLQYVQARLDLEKMMKKNNIIDEHIFDLSIENTQAVDGLLSRRFDEITISAPQSGIALMTSRESNDNTANALGLAVGQAVKEGDLLLSIGDLTGFSLKTQINEMDVNRLQVGMPVVVSGEAFPGHILKGVITGISDQAELSKSSDVSGNSLFSMQVEVPHVEPADLKWVHVGMSVQLHISILHPPALVLPLTAVHRYQEETWVQVILPGGRTERRPVSTGYTSPAGWVVIEKGLQAGDRVMNDRIEKDQ